METIAWVFYAADRNSFIELYKKYSNSKREIAASEVDAIAADSDPIKSDIDYFVWQNKRYGSFPIFSLLTIKQIASNRQDTINKLAKAVHIAEENGATLILLAGLLGNFALDVAKLKTKNSTKIHTGRNNLICTIVENFFRCCRRIKKQVADVNVTIFDASTKTAVMVSQILSKHGANVFLIDTGNRKAELHALTASKLTARDGIEDTVKSSDILINCIMQLPHSALNAIHPGTILLDSVPPYISSRLVQKSGQDIITEESVWIRSTKIDIKPNDEIFSGGLFYSCFGEAVMTVIEDTDDHLHQLSIENVEKFFTLRKKYGIEIP